jgi:hypothetical protein
MAVTAVAGEYAILLAILRRPGRLKADFLNGLLNAIRPVRWL